jgi:hypothetical protein
MTPSQERRAKPRFSVQLPIVVPATDDIPELHGVTRDVSTAGVFFYAESWPEELGQIRFRMILPSEVTSTESMRTLCKGRVVRVERDLPGGKTGVAATIDSYTWG